MDRAAAEPELPRADPAGQGLSGLLGPGVPSTLLRLWTQGCKGRGATFSSLGLQRRPLETAGCGGPCRPWPGVGSWVAGLQWVQEAWGHLPSGRLMGPRCCPSGHSWDPSGHMGSAGLE